MAKKENKTKIQLKTPTQARSRQTVATILEACAGLLIKESFYEITTDKIAKEAGVSIGSLYQFFGNKESVVLALIKKVDDEDRAYLLNRLKSNNDFSPSKKVQNLLEGIFEILTSNPELRTKIQSIQSYLLDPALTKERTDFYINLFKQALPQLQGRDMNQVTYVLVSLMVGGGINAISMERPDFIKDKALMTEIMRLVYRYIDLAEPTTSSQVASSSF